MSVEPKAIQDIAARLRQAAESGKAIPPIRDELAAGGVKAAYAVQQANTEHYLKQGRRLVGRKIGLTSKSVQKQLGVDSPDFGMLFADMALYDGEESRAGPGAAAQGRGGDCVRAGARPRPSRAPRWRTSCRRSRYALPAVEIVGSRIENWNIKLLDTIADNASSGLFVLGTAAAQARRGSTCACAEWRWSGAASRCRSAPVRRASGIRSTRRCGSRARWSTSAARSRPATSS